MKQKFEEIKQCYEEYSRDLLKQGRLPYKQTSKGIWGISDCDETFSIFNKLNLQKYSHFLDLGSGDGRVALIASLFTRATGIEIDPELYRKSIEIRNKLKLKANFHNKDFFTHDISKYDLVYSFPDRPLHYGMEQKLKDELKGKFLLMGNNIYPVDLKEEIKLATFGQPVTLYRNH